MAPSRVRRLLCLRVVGGRGGGRAVGPETWPLGPDVSRGAGHTQAQVKAHKALREGACRPKALGPHSRAVPHSSLPLLREECAAPLLQEVSASVPAPLPGGPPSVPAPLLQEVSARVFWHLSCRRLQGPSGLGVFRYWEGHLRTL